jgi:hypothetical protein
MLKFYKVTVASMLMNGSGCWMMKKVDRRAVERAEIKCLRFVAG